MVQILLEGAIGFGYILCTRQVPAEETAGTLTLGDKGFENEGC